MTEPERPSATMPAELTRRAAAIVAGTDDWSVPIARDAATVILLRETAAGIEVFLQRRVGAMKFAAGMHVFPGGKVEDEDADPDVPWNGDPSFEPFARPVDPGATTTFRALTVAAARETWEEAGVALASGPDGPVAGHPTQPDDPFLPWVRAAGLAVSADRFAPWGHWVTPEVESRRFDTRFLVAGLPEGQAAVDRGVESEVSVWVTPGAAMDELRAGRMPMLPPTAYSLEQLADFTTVASVVNEARARRPVPILPRPEADGGGGIRWLLVNPYDGVVIRPL